MLSLGLTSSPVVAQSALLDALSTRVTLTHPGGPADEIASERIIRSGDTVATDVNGRALVTYPDGSTALLEENSSLTIEFIRTNAGDYGVRMQQTLGRVWYAVTRAVTLGTRYEVRTASMASVIRAGSDSYVTVSPNGETTVVTISGTVDTSAGGTDVSVPAGSSTSVAGPGATPGPVRAAPAPPQPATVISSPTTPAPSTPSPTVTPAPTAPPSSTSAAVPAVSTLAPLPANPATPKPTALLPTPRPLAAPTPAPTPLQDRFGPRKDAPGQPPPKIRLL